MHKKRDRKRRSWPANITRLSRIVVLFAPSSTSTYKISNQQLAISTCQLAILLCGPDDDGAVLGTEAEAVAERGFNTGGAAAVWDVIEIAARVWFELVNRRRQELALDGERRGDDSGGPAGTLRMPDH